MPTGAVYYGQRDLRVEDIPAPSPGPGELLIDVAACGICGSDLHEYEAGPIVVPEEPHPLTGESMPLVLGHEFSGVVAERGAHVNEFEPGTPVTVNPMMPCGDCRYCNAGTYHLCVSMGSLGMTAGVDGAFADQVVVPADGAIELPPELRVADGALAEPLTVGLHAVRRSGLESGDTVAVFGAGPIGLAVLVAARAAGARTVLVSEPRDFRRDRARQGGADELFDPTSVDAVEAITDLTDGGVDVAFEVAGVESSVDAAIRSTRRRGTVTIVSLFEEEIAFQPNDVVMGERTITGTRGYLGGPRAAREWETTLGNLADGTIDPELFVTDRIPLADIVEAGFEELLDPESQQMKILVEP